MASARPLLLLYSDQMRGSRVLEDRYGALILAMVVRKSEFVEEAKASGLVKRAVEHAGKPGSVSRFSGPLPVHPDGCTPKNRFDSDRKRALGQLNVQEAHTHERINPKIRVTCHISIPPGMLPSREAARPPPSGTASPLSARKPLRRQGPITAFKGAGCERFTRNRRSCPRSDRSCVVRRPPSHQAPTLSPGERGPGGQRVRLCFMHICLCWAS
jgi:hypothetical protein